MKAEVLTAINCQDVTACSTAYTYIHRRFREACFHCLNCSPERVYTEDGKRKILQNIKALQIKTVSYSRILSSQTVLKMVQLLPPKHRKLITNQQVVVAYNRKLESSRNALRTSNNAIQTWFIINQKFYCAGHSPKLNFPNNLCL